MFDTFGDGWDGGTTSGITISSNGTVLISTDMTAGTIQTAIFGLNSNCSVDTTVACSTTIELVPDSLVEMANSVLIFWNDDLSTVSSVTWDFGNGMTSNEFYPAYFYDSIGTYTVCLTVNYVDSCSASTCTTFTMDANGVSSPGGIQMNGFWLNTTGAYPNAIAELDSTQTPVNMFPNPTSGSVAVKASKLNPSESTIIRIYSIDGKEVFANNFGNGAVNNTFQLNVSELSNGYYFLSLQNGNQIQRVPFVKE
jgi:PKD repeat protein